VGRRNPVWSRDELILALDLYMRFRPTLPNKASAEVTELSALPKPSQRIQVMSEEDIKVRRDPALRLPRQIEHIGRLVDHILSVKDSVQLRRSLAAHFGRLDAYRHAFLSAGTPVVRAPGQSDEE
jgi:hypothetical protein